MLYRLGRYGGMPAFRGMLPCDPPWTRPLLECRRAETAAYCRSCGLEFARDRGNAHPGYARTAIRDTVLPAWEEALPGAVDAAGRAAQVAAEMELLTEALVDRAEREVTASAAHNLGSAGGVTAGSEASQQSVLSVSGLLRLEPPLRRLLLHRWLERRARPSASRASVLALEALLVIPGSAERNLAGGWRGIKEYDGLSLVWGGRRLPAPAAPAVPLDVPGRACWSDARVTATLVDEYRSPDVSREAYVDARSVQGVVEVRGPRPGDRVRPLGMAGSRKLQDVLVDLRVPAAARPTTPLVVCDGRVIWVCGLLVAEEGRITAETTRIIRLEVSREPDTEVLKGTGGREGDGRT
jgi:tRNA(Ile)-lysidine synthase